MKKKVLVAGTFDLLHDGHRDFLRQASQLGRVFVVVARDSSVRLIKKRAPKKSERSRLATVASLKFVERAILGDRIDFLKSVERVQPDVIALGYDQQTFAMPKLKAELKQRNLAPAIVRLKSFQPEKYKTSLLRQK